MGQNSPSFDEMGCNS